VLVTHDRYMLDRVSTVIAGLDGKGAAAAFADCEQWETWKRSREAGGQGIKEPGVRESRSQGVKEKARKLSYIENREYERIEELIAEADERLRRGREEMQNPEASHDAGVVQGRYDELLAAQADVDRLYERWAELESKVAE
jgi:ATP-binding cassette subfamily F protein uup